MLRESATAMKSCRSTRSKRMEFAPTPCLRHGRRLVPLAPDCADCADRSMSPYRRFEVPAGPAANSVTNFTGEREPPVPLRFPEFAQECAATVHELRKV